MSRCPASLCVGLAPPHLGRLDEGEKQGRMDAIEIDGECDQRGRESRRGSGIECPIRQLALWGASGSSRDDRRLDSVLPGRLWARRSDNSAPEVR